MDERIFVLALLRRRDPKPTILKKVALTGFFMLLFMGTWAQVKQPALYFRNTPLKKVIAAIEERSGYVFIYADSRVDLGRKVSLETAATDIRQVLQQLFSQSADTFSIMGKQVILQRKKSRGDNTRVADGEEAVITVTGIVAGSDGTPLIGVSVGEKGTRNGAVTDEKGAYHLHAAPGATLEFSYLGYERKTLRAGTSSTRIDIVLEGSKTSLKDVVVVGYGTEKREKITSAISTVSGKELQNRAAVSIETMLQGKVPGLMIINNTGATGVANMFMVRGIAAVAREVNSNVVSPPLFVIDGVPMIQEVYPSGEVPGPLNSLLAGLNPYDIESIDIMKDASAGAIYGSRAANGVIFINTKRGRVGKPIVSIDAKTYVSTYPSLIETLGGAAERRLKIDLWRKYESEANRRLQGLPMELSDSLNGFYNNSTDWQKLLYRNGITNEVNMSVSGGNDKNTYRLGAGYSNSQGIIVGTGFKRYSLNFTGSYLPLRGLNINSNILLSQTDQSRGKGSAIDDLGVGKDYYSSLLPSPSSGFFTPFTDTYKNRTDQNLKRSVQVMLGGAYDVTSFLTLNSQVSVNYLMAKRRTFTPSALNNNKGPSASSYFEERLNLLNENFIRLHHTFGGKHTFNLVAGNTVNTEKTEILNGSGKNGPSDVVQVIDGYPQNNISVKGTYNSFGLLSYYSRLTYDYDAKYIMNLSWRADGSSKFGAQNRWGYFPAVSGAWLFTKEHFMENAFGKWLNFGKLRAGWGRAGKQYDDYYLAVGQYNVGSSPTGTTYGGIPIIRPNYEGANGIPLPNLGWEQTTDYNLGLDLELFNGRATFSYDYYWKRSDNFLFDNPLPASAGYAMTKINGGSLLNYGMEWAVNLFLMPAERKFQWNISANASFNKNILLRLPDNGRNIVRTKTPDNMRFANGNVLQVGRPLNGFYLYESRGVYRKPGDVPVNPYNGEALEQIAGGALYQTGDIWLVDQDHDYVLDPLYDRVYKGNPYPELYGGFSNTLRYGGFTFYTFFTYMLNRKVYNDVLRSRIASIDWKTATGTAPRNTPIVNNIDFWSPENPNGSYPILNPRRSNNFDNDINGYSPGNYGTADSDLFLEDGSFLRLKTVTLSYDFNNDWLRKIKMRRIRAYVTLENVFILQRYSGADAEIVDALGFDRGSGYPTPRNFSAGFNVEF